MTKEGLFAFFDKSELAVVSSVSPEGSPQSALIGIAVTQRLELIFDTLASTRKYRNLRHNARCSVVVGWNNETTLQLDGEARLLADDEREPYQEVYFRKWPACREHLTWPGISYFVVRPSWIRYSDYNRETYQIEEWQF